MILSRVMNLNILAKRKDTLATVTLGTAVTSAAALKHTMAAVFAIRYISLRPGAPRSAAVITSRSRFCAELVPQLESAMVYGHATHMRDGTRNYNGDDD